MSTCSAPAAATRTMRACSMRGASSAWFGAGQYYSLFMNIDTFPNTIDYWGPNGMVFVRNPQLRFTPYNRDGMKIAFSLEAPNAAIDTGKVSDVRPGARREHHGPQPISRIWSGSLRMDREMGSCAGGRASCARSASKRSARPNNKPSGDETGYGLNLSGWLNTFGKDRIIGQIVYGKGIASYMNDGGVDIAPGRRLAGRDRASRWAGSPTTTTTGTTSGAAPSATASIARPTPPASSPTRSRKAAMPRSICLVHPAQERDGRCGAAVGQAREQGRGLQQRPAHPVLRPSTRSSVPGSSHGIPSRVPDRDHR